MEKNLQAEIDSLQWFHSIDFGNGIISPGHKPLSLMKAEADIYFARGIQGRSFLDVGCWDGANSVEASRRGASRILATDHFVWTQGAVRRNIDLARTHIAPNIEAMDIDVMDLSPETVGRFDVVLFAGVFYHLRHPLLALERVAKLVVEELVVETHLDLFDCPRPAMVFYPGTQLNNDPTNWWGPNRICVEEMLRDLGFKTIEFTEHPVVGMGRGIFRALF